MRLRKVCVHSMPSSKQKAVCAAKKLFRETTDRIERAYTATGLKPRRFVLLHDGAGCALGAVQLYEGLRYSQLVMPNIDGDYGIACGFNGTPLGATDPSYRLGFAIGRYVAKRVLAPAHAQ